MTDKIIPEDVEQFILDKIESVAHIEALLIFRENPQQEWTADSLAKRLYINESQTTEILARLWSDGFVAPSVNEAHSYRYEPSSPELGQMINRMAETYRKHLVPVANLIHSKAKPRVQEFADAFRLRKDK